MISRREEPDKNRVIVRLMGEEYIIRGLDDPGHLSEVAAYVETRLRQEQEANPRLSKTQLAMLVTLRISDELLRLRKEHGEIHRLIAEAR